jgi:predicted ATPase
MPRLLGLKIQNYKSLIDVDLGQLFEEGTALPTLACFIGPNGSGKSTLLDAFGFMADCLREGVEAACDKPQRGGFSKLRSQGRSGPIRFFLYYREAPSTRPMVYVFSVESRSGIPVVIEEYLVYIRSSESTSYGPLLSLKDGEGLALTDESPNQTPMKVRLDDPSRLGIATLGNLKEHPRIVSLRSYIENWYLSYFVPDAARSLSQAGAQKHLNRTGENLGNYVQYLERSHPERFQRVLDQIARKIPGIRTISHERSPDGRLLLRFNEQGYIDPFFQQSMSDGTLKMFLYLLLLEDPEPFPLIGIEEPENGLYHKLLEELARELVRHAETGEDKTQIFITTHSPYFVDALKPEQVWLLEKDETGATRARRTADIPIVQEMIAEEIPLGSLWYSNHFEERFRG